MAGPKLGLVAGAGGLPLEIAALCRDQGRELFVVRLGGFADAGLQAFPGVDVGLGELGRCMKSLRAAGCSRVCLAGAVRRPDLSSLKVDFGGLMRLPAIAAAAAHGDDTLLRAVLGAFEAEGFVIEGVGEAAAPLLLSPGPQGAHAPDGADMGDISAAMAQARALGETDAGQAAVVRDGVAVALEGPDGTDAMLRRCAALTGPAVRRGVLAKAPKPIQDRRVDLPTIGVDTIENAARAGLKGVAGEAGGLLVVDRRATIAAADRLGLFLYGAGPP